MRTYTTLDRDVLDLSGLAPGEEAYLQECLVAYERDLCWEKFCVLVEGEGSPLVRAAGGRVTRAVYEHPLFRALRDLEDRVGIRQGVVGAEPGDPVDVDPFADEWLSVPVAAARKGVTVPGLHKAIKRGAVIAHPAPGRPTRLRVSANSLARWTPMAVRQAAGRFSARRRAADRAGSSEAAPPTAIAGVVEPVSAPALSHARG